MKCQNCGKELEENSMYCPFCGEQIKSNGVICPHCGKENSENAVFCSFCGETLENKTPVCEVCGKENQKGARYCAYCGAEITKKKKVKKGNGESGYKKVERILTPSIVLAFIVGLLVCSFFIGFTRIAAVGTSLTEESRSVFWFFGDAFKLLSEQAAVVNHLARNDSLLKAVFYIPNVVCVIALSLNFACLLTCFIVALVKLVKGITTKSRPDMQRIVAFSTASFLFAVFIAFGSNYVATSLYSGSAVNIRTVMSTGSVVGIVITIVSLIIALVLRSVAEGKNLLNKSMMAGYVCNIIIVALLFVSLVLSPALFNYCNSGGEGSLSAPTWMTLIYGQYIDSDVSFAMGSKVGSLLTYIAYVGFTVFVCLVVLCVVKNIFSDKKKFVGTLVMSIVAMILAVVLLGLSIYTDNQFISLINESEGYSTVYNQIGIVVLSVLAFALAIVNAVAQIKARRPQVGVRTGWIEK